MIPHNEDEANMSGLGLDDEFEDNSDLDLDAERMGRAGSPPDEAGLGAGDELGFDINSIEDESGLSPEGGLGAEGDELGLGDDEELSPEGEGDSAEALTRKIIGMIKKSGEDVEEVLAIMAAFTDDEGEDDIDTHSSLDMLDEVEAEGVEGEEDLLGAEGDELGLSPEGGNELALGDEFGAEDELGAEDEVSRNPLGLDDEITEKDLPI